eukprot:TRINITY_DN5412_c0_g1_i1.p1 TRINITY_DN5412_c0_g1~~TRINITY_DN5412_c0_g1_i1.p1  ORF type:complete len:543 (+),score=106.65 TRINITY_DN5412_c0_g1_i1:223-1629(+)
MMALFGLMVLSSYFEREHFFEALTRLFLLKARSPFDVLLRVCGSAAVLSALFTNDTTCVMMTPVVVRLCLKQNFPMLPYLLALATCANVGSSMTPIGNPQNIIIASFSGITFLSFLKYLTAATVASMALNAALLSVFLFVHRRMFRPASVEGGNPPTPLPGEVSSPELKPKRALDAGSGCEGGDVELQPVSSDSGPAAVVVAGEAAARSSSTSAEESLLGTPYEEQPTAIPEPAQHADEATNVVPAPGAEPRPVVDWISRHCPERLVQLWTAYAFRVAIVATVVGIMACFLAGLHLGWTCLAGASLLIACDAVLNGRDAYAILPCVDWLLLLFFGGLFVTIRGAFNSGIPLELFDAVKPYLRLDTAAGVAVYCAFLLAASNVLSNVPTILLLSPFIPQLGNANRAWMLAAFVSTVAGNLTLVGSVANLIVAEHSAPHYQLTFLRYLPYGFPSTCVITALGAVLVVACT